VFSLLRLGADPTVRNANGLTAADVAREGPSKQLALVALLAWGRMQASADRARAEELRTQLDEARRSVSELEQKALASEARAVRAERSEKEALRALSVQAPQAEFEEVKDPTEIIEKMSFIHDLGAGNTSRVHPGVWRREPVAVKVSPTGLTEKQLDALHAEAELHGRIGQHPRIVKLLAFAIDRSKRRALLVLRLAKNGSLKDALERKRFAGSGDTLLLVRVLFEAAEGFAFLHSIGILHRDIACRNILLDEGDHALVSDLGFARKLAANAEYYKAAPLTQRPFQWMAPEEHEHNRFDFASDVYMFGMTMWEALSRGRRFFDSNDPETVKAKIVAGERPRPLEPALCPPSVGALIERCTAHDPKARPSMKDVATELDRVLSQELKNSAHIAGRDDVQRFEQNSSAALMFFVQRIDRRLNEILDH
jgi:serine/threonine protein kinase